MSLTSSTVSGAVGTPPAARGGAPRPHRHSGAGAVGASGDAFSTLLGDVPRLERSHAQPERASAPAPARQSRLAALRRAVDVPLPERPAKSEAKSPVAVAASPVMVQPTVAEGSPESLGGAATSAASVTPEPGDWPDDGVATVDYPGGGLDGSGSPLLVPSPGTSSVHHSVDRSPSAAAAPDAKNGDSPPPAAVERALAPARAAAHPAPETHAALQAQVDLPAEADAPDVLDGWQDVAATARVAPPPPAVAATPDVPSAVEAPAQALIVQATARAMSASAGLPGGTLADAATSGIADVVPVPGREQDQSDGESGSRDGGAGRDDVQANGGGQPVVFAVRSYGDGATLEPPAVEGSDASERALDHQLVQAMRVQWRGGLGEATITLRPQYLGQVRISLRLDGGALLAHLQVEDPKVRSWVQSHAHLLKNGLAEQGLDLARLVVSDEPSDSERREEAPEERGRGRSRSQRPWPATDGDDTPRFEVRV